MHNAILKLLQKVLKMFTLTFLEYYLNLELCLTGIIVLMNVNK